MASLDVDDTIVAIASPPGASSRGILRLSGPQTLRCLENCFVPEDGRELSRQAIVDAIDGRLQLTDDLLLPGRLSIWPTERSYTRQPSAEFHTIGSTALLQVALETFCKAGSRVARPGEFTLRAFLSGRLDLTQAEAVLAVIDAQGQSDLRNSLDQLAGGLATPLTNIRDDLISILAELEAQLDFVEEDIEFISNEVLMEKLNKASEQLNSILDQISHRHIVDEDFTAVLTGLPNAGKSSLFNCLLNETKAIVTDVAGTTTDYVTGIMTRNGISVQLIDTAGVEYLDATENESKTIRASAQNHRAHRIERADLCVHCLAADSDQTDVTAHASALISANRKTSILVITRTDQPLDSHVESFLDRPDFASIPVIYTSSVTQEGIARLKETLFQFAIDSRTADCPIVASTLRRSSDSLKAAAKSVQLAARAAVNGTGEELVAAEIRQALEHLGYIVGTIYTDDILDVVFGQFCIGK